MLAAGAHRAALSTVQSNMAANAAAFAVLVVLITTQGRAQEDSAELSEGEPLESRARAVCPVSGASYHELR